MRHPITLLIALTITAMLVTSSTRAEPTRDQLWHAVCQVESGGNPKAHAKGEDARGIAQIRAIMVKDVNRILGHAKYTHDDAWDPVKSREMFDVYLDHYWPGGTAEECARAWNGGPRGPSKPATADYWRKVKWHLD